MTSRHFFSALLLGVSATAFTTQVQAIAPFKADYTFNIANMISGKASRTLTEDNGVWNYTFKASVPMMADATETSIFRLNNATAIQATSQSKKSKHAKVQNMIAQTQPETVESLEHSYNFRFLNNVRNNHIKFDWPSKTVQSSTEKGDSSYPAQVGALDMLNLEIQVREDLHHQQLKSEYLLANEKETHPVMFVADGNETIQTPAGTFDTVKYHLVQDGEKRKTYFWLAPKLDNLPVRVHQTDGKLEYEINLSSYEPQDKAKI